MASSGNFAMASSTHHRQQHGGEGTAALTLKADELQHSTNPHVPAQLVEDDSSDEEDVHQCGRCKDIFRSLQLYMQHKASKVCKLPKAAPVQRQPDPPQQHVAVQQPENNNQQHTRTIKPSNILEEAAKDTIYKQLEILVVEEEEQPQETHSTVDVQSISNEQTASYVALQNRDDDTTKLNLPIMVSKEAQVQAQAQTQTQGNKKGGRGRPRKSQPIKIVSPTGSAPSVIPTTASVAVMTSEGKPMPQRKRSKPRQVFPIGIEPLTADTVTVTAIQEDENEDGDEEETKKKRSRQPKMKKTPTSFPCSICKLEFNNKQQMLEHRGKHTKLYKCKTCSEGFYTEEKLSRHMEKESHNYPCEHCGKVLVSKASLQRHKVVHGEKNHLCDVCNRAFKTARDMKNHKLGVHSEEKNFLCEHCGKAFARREKLKRHSLIHSPTRPCFTCPFKNHTGCDKVFYRKDKLTRHLYSHSKIKPFKCDHCLKTFARTDNLREHMRTHTGVFRYYCTICGKGQPGPKKYQQHMLKQHNIENFEVPIPIEENAPTELVEQHKAVVLAETTTRASRVVKARKKSHGELDLGGAHEVDQDFASLHHTTMVTSYSTVSLRDIDPIATMHNQHALLQQAAAQENPATPTAIHPRPPQAEDNAMRVNPHEQPKQEYNVQEMNRNMLEMARNAVPEMVRVPISDMARNAVQDMGRASVHDMGRSSVQDMGRSSVHDMGRSSVHDMGRSSVHDMGRASVDMTHGNVNDMGRSSVSEMNRNEDMGRGTPQMNRQEMTRSVNEMARNVSDLSRTVPELRMKVPEMVRPSAHEIVRSMPDMQRNVQEIPRRGHPDMGRAAEMASNIMVPTSHQERVAMVSGAAHGDRGNIMAVTSHGERPNIMVPVSHSERGNIMVPSSHAERVGIHLLPQSVIQQNMHFTNLLNMNSDLASIGEAVVRNQGLPVMSSIFKTFHGQSMQ